jgi:glycosyltransferase involved in cell wall biosynthesis
MRILYLSQYFPPEAGATQNRAFEMGRNWVRLGHRVTVLAEIPNHPSGIIPPEFRGRLYERAELEGMQVIRLWVKASPKKNFTNRMAFYLSYMFNAILAGLLLARGRFDLIYASSPPLFVGAAALALSKLRRTPLVFEVRDLWPESAVALGELSDRQAIALATRLEEACYRQARLVVVVTRGVLSTLQARGVPLEKLALIPNGANVDQFQFQPEGREQIRRELGLGDKFVAIYAGIFGIAQQLETVIEAARLVRDDPTFHFILIGDGPRRADLIAQAELQALTNLTILPEMPPERIPAYLSAADLALVPLRNLDLFSGALPSKLVDAWACQRPVLLSIAGEAKAILEQAGGGLFVPPEDPLALIEALRSVQIQPELRKQMGDAGRAYTVAHHSRRALAEKLAERLEALFCREKRA